MDQPPKSLESNERDLKGSWTYLNSQLQITKRNSDNYVYDADFYLYKQASWLKIPIQLAQKGIDQQRKNVIYLSVCQSPQTHP